MISVFTPAAVGTNESVQLEVILISVFSASILPVQNVVIRVD